MFLFLVLFAFSLGFSVPLSNIDRFQYFPPQKRSISSLLEQQSTTPPSFDPMPMLTSTSHSFGTLYLTFYKSGVGLLFNLSDTQEIMVDPTNERYSVQSPNFGKQYTFVNGTYFVTSTGSCSYTNATYVGNEGANYYGQINAYQRSRHVDTLGFFERQKFFVGLAYDVSGCGQPIANVQGLATTTNAQTRNWFSQVLPGTLVDGVCLPGFASTLTGSVISDFARGFLPSVNIVSNFFQLPSSCLVSDVPDYCAITCHSCITYPCP